MTSPRTLLESASLGSNARSCSRAARRPFSSTLLRRTVVVSLPRLACLTLLLLAGVPAHAMTPRLVEIVVSIESPQFRDGLGEARRQQIEATIAAQVAASLAQQFPLIDWK